MEEFKNRTKSRKEFEVTNVKGDGSCLYRSMIRYLVDNQKKHNGNEYFYKIFYNTTLSEGKAAESLQYVLKDWIIEHQNDVLDSFMNIEGCIADLVCMSHEWIQNMDFYNYLYSIWAGNPNFIVEKTDNKDKRGRNIYKRIDIPSRWGGVPEIYAFYKIFGVRVNQWTVQRWDKKENKPKQTVYDNTHGRYLLIQTIGLETDEYEMNLLYIDFKIILRHYMYMKRKNIENTEEDEALEG
jgi:hypothetical protein